MNKLKEDYEIACNNYIKEFVKKQKYKFDYWIADEVGGIASFIEQYYFNFSDIKYDIDNNIKKGVIFEWQDSYVDNYDYNNNISTIKKINYKNFCKLHK